MKQPDSRHHKNAPATKPEQPKPTSYWSEMPLVRLYPSPTNARSNFDEAALRDLATNIATDGIINPLTIIDRNQPDPKNGGSTFTVIAGERRRRAATLAGLQHVPVVLLNDPQLIANATRIAIAENTVRESLNHYEETMAILDYTILLLSQQQDKWPIYSAQHPTERHAAGHAIWLLAKAGKRHAELETSTGVTAKQLEQHFSGLLGQRDGFRPISFVNNRLKLLDLPHDIQQACQTGQLDYTKANLVARIEDKEQRQAVLDRAMKESLTHEKLATIVKETQGKRETPQQVIKSLKRVERTLKSSWFTLTDNDRARAERLLRDLEKAVGPSKRQRTAGKAPITTS